MRTAGFTLVELVIVVMILGLLAALAAPRFIDVSGDAAVAAAASDLEAIQNSLQVAYASSGSVPADVPSGQVPPELEPLLCSHFRFDTTPLGGRYDWQGPGSGLPYYGISIRYGDGDSPPLDELQQLDEMLDDGNLSTGSAALVTMGPTSYFLLHFLDP